MLDLEMSVLQLAQRSWHSIEKYTDLALTGAYLSHPG
jgi:hypothetical protein